MSGCSWLTSVLNLFYIKTITLVTILPDIIFQDFVRYLTFLKLLIIALNLDLSYEEVKIGLYCLDIDLRYLKSSWFYKLKILWILVRHVCYLVLNKCIFDVSTYVYRTSTPRYDLFISKIRTILFNSSN